jgi:hypothetical protein
MAASLGKIATTSVRRLISPFKRSSGLSNRYEIGGADVRLRF